MSEPLYIAIPTHRPELARQVRQALSDEPIRFSEESSLENFLAQLDQTHPDLFLVDPSDTGTPLAPLGHRPGRNRSGAGSFLG